MGLIAKDTSNGADFAPIAAGLQHGICYAIYDIGTQPKFGNFPARPKVIICWEVPSERITLERDGKKVDLPRGISQKYTLSLASKGNLRPMLESWRGRPFTPEELEGFDLKNILGANCYLNVVHENGKGEKASRVYANVASVNPLPKGTEKRKPENPTVLFSMSDFTGPVTIPASVPEWVTALIIQSEEYQAKAQLSNAPAPSGEKPMEDLDEDVPF